MQSFLFLITIINAICVIALGELNRFHAVLRVKGLTTLDYLKKTDKVNKKSKINVKI